MTSRRANRDIRIRKERPETKKRATRDSGRSFDQSPKKETSALSLPGTPFHPHMEEHAAALSSTASSADGHQYARQLQQTYGNRYVQRLLESTGVQAKLTVGNPGDIHEQEADRVADQVTGSEASQAQKVPEEEEPVQAKAAVGRQVSQEEEEVQRESILRAAEQEELSILNDGSQAPEVSEDIERRINASRAGGHSLSGDVKGAMEQAFSADFGGVRLHTDSEADGLNRQLSAKAFTTGQDIFFRDGEYSPSSDGGQKLIAHELTHVVQQSAGSVRRRSRTAKVEAPAIHETPTGVQRTTFEDVRKGEAGGVESSKLKKYCLGIIGPAESAADIFAAVKAYVAVNAKYEGGASRLGPAIEARTFNCESVTALLCLCYLSKHDGSVSKFRVGGGGAVLSKERLRSPFANLPPNVKDVSQPAVLEDRYYFADHTVANIEGVKYDVVSGEYGDMEDVWVAKPTSAAAGQKTCSVGIWDCTMNLVSEKDNTWNILAQ